MENKYQSIASKVLKEVETELNHPVIVKHWKSNRPYSGKAYCKTYTIITPEPKSDISLNTYLHELGHIVTTHKLSCMREYLACNFALDKMRDNGLSISRKIKKHHNWYIAFSLAQALNRNLKTIPDDLKPFKKYLTVRYSHTMTVKNGIKSFSKNKRYISDISKC